jgi:uncharacterized protein
MHHTKEIEIKIWPKDIEDADKIALQVKKSLGVSDHENVYFRVLKKSIDARSTPFYLLKIEVSFLPFEDEAALVDSFKNVEKSTKVVIIGAGPAGYFAALKCLALGLKPIVVERGKDVQTRRRDLRAIQQFGTVNPESNYCFGEGGAGTYSDGKLYTRSHKRGSIYEVLKLLVEHGATPEILVDAHPHIGSNKLPQIIAEIRNTIIKYGGEIYFDTKIVDFEIDNHCIKSAIAHDGKSFEGASFILATGHSARDIFYLLHHKNITIEAKPFALGVRIEHAQSYIDQLQYKQSPREINLPAASYKTVCQVQGKGVFSFCMCPGGLIVPAATSPGEIVVNGMSLSRRDSAFANSGFVTSIELEELAKYKYEGVFAALAFQEEVEKAMFKSGDGSQKAPAQRVSDFVSGVVSSSLYESSYIPGLISAPVHEILPEFAATRLRKAVAEINKKMKGYLTENANVIGTESRTSSPIKIPRDKVLFHHPQVTNLYPCGEGAGYAGGILSAAMDGQNVVEAIYKSLLR